MTLSEIDVHADAHEVRCPRCGYDQRGEINRWAESCPVDGICAECGLGFEWSEVFNPRRTLPSWCVEAQRGILHWPGQFIRTSLRAWWPTLLWRPLKMTHQPCQWRQCGFVVAWLAMVILALLTINGARAVASWQSMSMSRLGKPSTGAWPVFMQATFLPWSSASIGTFAGVATPAVAARVRNPFLPMQISFMTRPAGTTRPFPYIAPRQHLVALKRHWPLLGLAALPVFTALAFAALPVSRRMAKVRWRHLRRAMAYAFSHAGLTILAVLLHQMMVVLSRMPATTTAGATWGQHSAALLASMLDLLTAILIVLSPLIVLVYWWSCARLHLRMMQAWMIALSVTLIGVLASGGLAFWIAVWAGIIK